MARPLRIQYPGAVYHVTSRGNERKPIVKDDKDRWLFLGVLEDMVGSYGVIIHAWVLMDNHYHLLIETPEGNLSQAIRHLNGVYTLRFNRGHKRFGHLFQGRYKAILVHKDSYLKELCRYVVLNPVRAKMVKHPKEWKWSSYRATAGYETVPEWLEVKWLIEPFAKIEHRAQELYRQFVLEGLKMKESPWDQVKGQVLLGVKEFEEHIKVKIRGKHHAEAPGKQQKLGLPDSRETLESIGKLYGMSVKDIVIPVRQKNEGREVTVWALRQLCRLSLGEVAEIMGVKYSAVSHAVARMKKRMREEKGFEQKVRNAVFKT
jgi:putative transposase